MYRWRLCCEDSDDECARCRRDEGDFAESEGEGLEEFLGILGRVFASEREGVVHDRWGRRQEEEGGRRKGREQEI